MANNELFTLSHDSLAKIAGSEAPQDELFNLPEKVLLFGAGALLIIPWWTAL